MSGNHSSPSSSSIPQDPYVGLQPYTENERDRFFGRDADRRVLVDMVLANRLTLLFAASGVGKSSLLRASVLPHLTEPAKENLDAIYCHNWVGNPLNSIRDAALKALTKSGRLTEDALGSETKSQPLPEFFRACCAFTRQPLVIVLDQFEEFFRYHLGSPDFPTYLRQLVELITDRTISVAIVLSMREDFALQLNAFKPEIPIILFNNFYRLEKLPLSEAMTAITEPVKKLGFTYEPELLEKLLKDFSARESKRHFDKPLLDSGLRVEPPYLQIICTQLFALEKNNPARKLQLKTYDEQGGAVGLLKKYIDRITVDLSQPERKLASQCFSFLVTRRGTKVARTAQDLASELHVPEERLAKLMEKLENARLLRQQTDGTQVYYELYHDLFSDSIEQWNIRFQNRERIKKTIFSVCAILAGAVLSYLGIDVALNLTRHHLRLSVKDGVRGQVELYRGNTSTLDPFRLQRYVAETEITYQQIEADQRFTQKPILQLPRLVNEWTERLPAIERLRYNREHGRIDDAMLAARVLLGVKDATRLREAIKLLSQIETKQSFDEIAAAMNKGDPRLLARAIFSDTNPDDDSIDFGEVPLEKSRAAESFLIEYLKEPTYPLRKDAAGLLGHWHSVYAAPALAELLKAGGEEEREAAVNALVELPSADAHKLLFATIAQHTEENRESILRNLVSNWNPVQLNEILSAVSPGLRIELIKAIGSNMVELPQLEFYLNDPDDGVAVAAAESLKFPVSPSVLQKIQNRMDSSKDAMSKGRFAAALRALNPPQNLIIQQYTKFLSNPRLKHRPQLGGCDNFQAIWPQVAPSLPILRRLLTELDKEESKFLFGCLPSHFLRGTESTLRSSLTASTSNPAQRRPFVALARLVDLDPAQAMLTIRSLLKGDFEQRTLAVEGLTRLATPAAATLLAELAADRKQPEFLRLSALTEAKDVDSGSVAPETKRLVAARLRDVLRDVNSGKLRTPAIEALVEWIGLDAIEDFRTFFATANEFEQRSTISALLRLRSPQARSVIMSALKSPTKATYISTRLAMEGHPAAALAHLDELSALLLPPGKTLSKAQRSDAERLLAELTKLEVPVAPTVIAAALAATDRRIHDEALKLAGTVGDLRFRAALISQLAVSDDRLRLRALDAFVPLARAADLPALREALRHAPQELDGGDDSGLYRQMLNLDVALVFELSAQPKIADEAAPSAGAKAVTAFIGPLGNAWDWLQFPELTVEDPAPAQPLEALSRVLASQGEIEEPLFGALRQEEDPRVDELLWKALNGKLRKTTLQTAQVLAERKGVQSFGPIFQRINSLYSQQIKALDSVTSSDAPLFTRGFGLRVYHLAQLLASVNASTPDLDPVLLSEPLLKRRLFVPLLAALCQKPALQDMLDPSYLTIKQRADAADLLAGQSWRCSEAVLGKLAEDPSTRVQTRVAQALGTIKAPWVNRMLLRLLSDAKAPVKQAAAEALAQVAKGENFPAIKAAVLDKEMPLLVIVPLFQALGHIGTPEAIAVLLEAAKLYEDSIGRHAYRVLGDIRAAQVVPQLLARIDEYNRATQVWRTNRDRPADDAPVKAPEEGRKSPQRPQSHTIFELATTLGRLSDLHTIKPLLHHNLADVREAAALGLATHGSVEVVDKLDELRAGSSEPLFRRATFRCIDTSLAVIQKIGTAQHLAALKALKERVKDKDGVLSRVNWTIAELEARVYGKN